MCVCVCIYIYIYTYMYVWVCLICIHFCVVKLNVLFIKLSWCLTSMKFKSTTGCLQKCNSYVEKRREGEEEEEGELGVDIYREITLVLYLVVYVVILAIFDSMVMLFVCCYAYVWVSSWWYYWNANASVHAQGFALYTYFVVKAKQVHKTIMKEKQNRIHKQMSSGRNCFKRWCLKNRRRDDNKKASRGQGQNICKRMRFAYVIEFYVERIHFRIRR